MTAQAGERLFYKGEEIWMAAEPLNEYLKNRSDISFVSPTTACWRGYYGQWEIIDNKLNLIELKAYIEGYREVGLNYLFPDKNKVFANWFSGEIRIPQGEMLDYVHMGYASLYEKDLILVIENGMLVNEYVVDNEAEYQERLKKKKQWKMERPEKEVKAKKKERIFTVIALILFVLVLIGTSISVLNLIKLGTILAYFISSTIIIPFILMLGGVIFLIFNKEKEKQKEDKIIAFIGINFLVFVFIGICIDVFFLIKWGTILAYLISAVMVSGVLYLIFIAIKNRMQNKKNIN